MFELLEDPNVLKLPFERSQWVNQEEKRHISYSVNLPSGVQPGHVMYRVVNDGHCLQLTITWPKEFTDPEKILYGEKLDATTSEDQNKLANYYPKLQGYKNYLKSIRTSETDRIKQVMPISLPFQVETQISPSMVNFYQLHDSTCCVIEVTLTEVSSLYFENRGSGDFKKL